MRTTTRHDYTAAIRRALDVAFGVDAAFGVDEPLPGVAALADAAGFSPFHFSRIFAGMVGETPSELLRRIRLERAAHALIVGELSVTRIAFLCGYDSAEAFCRAFRAAFFCALSLFAARNLSTKLPSPTQLHFDPSGNPPTFRPRPTRKGHTMDVRIEESFAPQRLVALRHVGPYWQIGSSFGRLHEWRKESSTTQVGPDVAIYHDDPGSVAPENLRSDACFPVSADFVPDNPELTLIDLPGGRYAVATHVGDYSRMSESWMTFMGEWLPTSGVTPDSARPCFEVYVDDCDLVPVDRLRTDLYMGIEG